MALCGKQTLLAYVEETKRRRSGATSRTAHICLGALPDSVRIF